MKLNLSIARIVFASILMLVFSNQALAQPRYVTDEFEIMMRTGPSIQNKIVRALKSGTRIEVLREDSGNGHSQVQTSQGEIGYVLTRFLSDNQSARNRVRYLEGQLKTLRSKPGELQALLATSQEENQILIGENTRLTNQLTNATKELATIKEVSKDAVNLSERNIRFESEVQQLLLQLDDIRIQNETLKDNADYVRNLTMAGILLLGLFLGWVLSRSGKQNRNSWGT
jgi:SH3 domain protein